MSRTILGDACAFIPGKNGEKNRYLKLGLAMKDDSGRLSLKLDTLPLPGSDWEGWINVFEREPAAIPVRTAPPRYAPDDLDDDIPF